MSNLLITGATGNIGLEVIRFLYKINTSQTIIAGVRNVENAKMTFTNYDKLHYVYFDFENFETFDIALRGVDTVFLLRPPHISDVHRYFKPFILSMQKNNIKNIVFLSVQGVEKSTIIPHNKIERWINNSGLNYIFLRPSYFMQNLTTTLLNDIKTKREIILPSGNAKFNWIDIENIAEAAVTVLENFEHYKNQAFEITGLENKNFENVVSIINQNIENPIRFRSLNPFKFYRIKKREGMKTGFILVMIMLHFLPRFQKEPRTSVSYHQLTGKNPTDVETFIKREKHQFE